MKRITREHRLGRRIFTNYKVPYTNKNGALYREKKSSDADQVIYRKRPVRTVGEFFYNYKISIRSHGDPNGDSRSSLEIMDDKENHSMSRSLSSVADSEASTFSSRSASASKASTVMTQATLQSLISSNSIKTSQSASRSISLAVAKSMEAFMKTRSTSTNSSSSSVTDDSVSNSANSHTASNSDHLGHNPEPIQGILGSNMDDDLTQK